MAGIEITPDFRKKVERDAVTLGYDNNPLAWKNLGFYWEKQAEAYNPDESEEPEKTMEEKRNALLSAYICYENALKLAPKDSEAKKALKRLEKALK